MSDLHRFAEVKFRHFKAFKNFTLQLRSFNVLVGPNNAGKSTVLAAFRILDSAMRKASAKKPELVRGPLGQEYGYKVDLEAISVAEENIFFNYDDSEPAVVTFKISNGNELILYFPEPRECRLLLRNSGRPIQGPSGFQNSYNCPIGFVPILGPVEHDEQLYEKEAARRALFNYRASRNFRNIWFHYPAGFDDFRSLITQTWSGMDIERPIVDRSHSKPLLRMFCPEDRIPREIFWAGFGFQVWCQLLTHIIQGRGKALFLIDEPDIYLHSDLQRQLVNLLRSLGPDILVATHSTEILSEAEAEDIVLINKQSRSARRIKQPEQRAEAFAALGSSLNPVLTQLAKTRKAVFVEGKDFQVIGKFARKLGVNRVANRTDFAVVPVDGFSPDRVRDLKQGMEATLGREVKAFAIFDRDYRGEEERAAIIQTCLQFCNYAVVHESKEIENFLLAPISIDRAARRKVGGQSQRLGKKSDYVDCASDLLREYAASTRDYVASRLVGNAQRFENKQSQRRHPDAVAEAALGELTVNWSDEQKRMRLIPGKEALSYVNRALQERCGISITPTGIIDAMLREEVPQEMAELVRRLLEFCSSE